MFLSRCSLLVQDPGTGDDPSSARAQSGSPNTRTVSFSRRVTTLTNLLEGRASSLGSVVAATRSVTRTSLFGTPMDLPITRAWRTSRSCLPKWRRFDSALITFAFSTRPTMCPLPLRSSTRALKLRSQRLSLGHAARPLARATFDLFLLMSGMFSTCGFGTQCHYRTLVSK